MRTAILSLLILLLLASPLSAEVPYLINYQGILTDDGGTPLDGTYDLTFKIYPDSMLGTSEYWTEFHDDVEVSEGLYNIILGSVTDIPDTLFQGEERWMGLTVDLDAEIRPLMRITAAPWALRAAIADSLAGGGGGNTLNEAYDEGGPGAGGTINVDAGGVVLDATANGENNPALIIQGDDLYEAGLEILNDMYAWQVHVQDNGELGITKGKAITPLRIAENSFNNELVLTSTGVAINTNTAVEKLTVNGAINIGDADNSNAGTIKWDGADFFGYDGATWKSLTATGGGSDDGDWTISGSNLYSAVSGRVGIGDDMINAKLEVKAVEELAGMFSVVDPSGTSTAIALQVFNHGKGDGVWSFTTNRGGSAGYFENQHPNNFDPSLHVVNEGSGYAGLFEQNYNNSVTPALGVQNDGLGPAVYIQSLNASNDEPALYTNNLGSGPAAHFAYGGVRIGPDAGPVTEALEVNGGINLGNTFENVEGTIRYNGADFLGYDGSTWNSLTETDDGDWNISSGNVYSAVSGNVGIGTMTPSEKLDVVGTAQVSENAYVSGNVGIGTITPSAKLDVAGTAQVSGDAYVSGNVGVGTLTPSVKLDVDGDANVTGSVQTTGFEMPTGAADGYVLTSDATGIASWQSTAVVSDGDWTIAGDDIYLSQSGGVGIGVTNPECDLHIYNFYSDVLFGSSTSGAGAKLLWKGGSGSTGQGVFRAGIVTGDQWDSSNIGHCSFASGEDTKASGDYSTAMGYLSEATGTYSFAVGGGQATGGGAIALMGTAEGSGSVSIGSGSFASFRNNGVAIAGGKTTWGSCAIGVASLADAVGSIAIGSSFEGWGAEAHQAQAISIGFDIYNTAKRGISLGHGVNPSAYAGVAVGSYNAARSGDDLYWIDTDPVFEVGNGEDESNKSTAMTILKNGNVGIGTQEPEVSLHLVHSPGWPENGGGLKLENSDSEFFDWTFYVHAGAGDLFLYHNDIFKGQWTEIDGTYTPVSDARLKKDVEPLRDVMPMVKQLEPSTFRFIHQSDQGNKSIGLIAQDVKEHFPEIVYEGGEVDDDNMYTLDYSKFGVIAVKAIQEQQKLIEKQAELIKELENRIAKLENK